MGQGHPGGMAHGRGPQRPNMVRGQGLPNPAFLPMPPGLPMPGMMGPMMGMGPSASSQRGGHQVVITSLLWLTEFHSIGIHNNKFPYSM